MPPSTIPLSSRHEIARDRNVPKYNDKSVTFSEHSNNDKKPPATTITSETKIPTAARDVINLRSKHRTESSNDVTEDEVIESNNRNGSQQTLDVAAPTALSPYTSANIYGEGLGGVGMYGGGGYGGMYGSPYAMPPMMMGGGMMMGGPFQNLTQCLYGIQTVIFSLGQAVQIIGMNTQAMHQLFDSASSMVDCALSTYHEMRLLDDNKDRNEKEESEEEKKRRRRLRALRYTMVIASTYLGYKALCRLIMLLFRSPSRDRHLLTSGRQASPQHHLQRYGQSYSDNSYCNNLSNSGNYHYGQRYPMSSSYTGSAGYPNSGMYGNGSFY